MHMTSTVDIIWNLANLNRQTLNPENLFILSRMIYWMAKISQNAVNWVGGCGI